MPDFNNYDDLVEEGIRVAKQFSHIKDIKREFKAATGKDLILTDPTYVGKRQDVEDMFKYLRNQNAWALDTEVIPSAGRVGLITIAAGNKTYAINMNQIRSDPNLMGFFKTKMERYANRDDRHLVFHNRKWDLDHLAKDAIKLFVTDSKGQVRIHDTMVVSRKMGEAGVKGEVGTSNALGEASLRQLGKVLMKGTSGKLYDYVEDVVKRHGMSTAFLRYGASDVAATLELFKKYYGNTNNPNLSHIEGLTPEQLKKVQEADSLDYIRLTLNKAPPGIHQLLSGNSVAASYLVKDKKNPNRIFVKSYLDPREFVQEEWMKMIDPSNIRARHDELVHNQMLAGKSEQEAKKIAYEQQQAEISKELVSHGINVHSFIAAAFKGEAGYNPNVMIRAAPSFVVRQFAKAMGLVGYDSKDPSRHYEKSFFINPSGQRTDPGETPGFFKAIALMHRSYNKVPSVFTRSTMDWLPKDAKMDKYSINSAINKVYGRLKNGNVDLKRLPKGMRIPELPEGIGTKMYVDAVRYLTKYGIDEADVFDQPEHFIHEYQRKLVNDLMGLSDLSKYYHDKEFGLGGFRDMVTATFAGRRWTKTAIPMFSADAAYAERDNALRRGDAKEILWDAEMHPILDPDILPGLLSFQEKKKASVVKHTVASSNSKKALEEKSFFEQYRGNLFRSSEIARYMRFGKGWKKDDEEVIAGKIRTLEAQGKTDDEIQNLLQGEEEELYKALRSPVLYRKSAEWTDTARTVVDDELAEKLKSTYYDRREGYSPEIQGMIERSISWKDVKVPQIDENTGKYVRDPEGNVLYKTERMPVFGAPDERLIQVGRSQNIPLTTGWYIGTVGSKLHSLVSKKVFRHDLFMKSMPRYNSKVYAETDYGKKVYAEDAYNFMTQGDIMKNIPDAETAKQVAKRIKEMIQEEQVARASGNGYYSDAQVLKLSRVFTKVMNARVMAKQKARKMWLDAAVDKFGVLKGQVCEVSRLIPGRHYTGDGVSEPVSTWQQGIEHPIDRTQHDKMAIRYSRGFKEMTGVFEDSNEIGNFMNFIKGVSGSYGADEGATKEEKFAHDHVMKSMEDLVKSRGLDKKGSYIDEGQSMLTAEQQKMYKIASDVSDEAKWLDDISGTWRAAVRGELFHNINKRTPVFDVQLTDQEGRPLFGSPISTNDISIMERAGKSFLPKYGVSDIIKGKGIKFGEELPDIDVSLPDILDSFNVAGRTILTNRTLGSTAYQITQAILTPALQKYAEKAKAEKSAKAAKAREARQKAMESTFSGSIPVEIEVAHKNKGRHKGTNVSEYDSNDPSTKGDSRYLPDNTGRNEADDLIYHKQQFNVRYGRDISKIVRDTGEWAAKSNVQFGDNIIKDTYGTIRKYLEYFGPGGEVIDVFGADYAVHTQLPHEDKGFKDLLNTQNPHIRNKYGDVMIKAIQESIRRKPQDEQVRIISDMMNSVTGYDSLQGFQKRTDQRQAVEMEYQGIEKSNSIFYFLNDADPEYIRDYFGNNVMAEALVEINKIGRNEGISVTEAVTKYFDKYKDNPDKISDYWQAISAHEHMSETSPLIDEDTIQDLVYNKKPYRFDESNYFGPEEYQSGDLAMHPAGFTDLDYDVYKNYAKFMEQGYFPAQKMPRIVIPTWHDEFPSVATTAGSYHLNMSPLPAYNETIVGRSGKAPVHFQPKIVFVRKPIHDESGRITGFSDDYEEMVVPEYTMPGYGPSKETQYTRVMDSLSGTGFFNKDTRYFDSRESGPGITFWDVDDQFKSDVLKNLSKFPAPLAHLLGKDSIGVTKKVPDELVVDTHEGGQWGYGSSGVTSSGGGPTIPLITPEHALHEFIHSAIDDNIKEFLSKRSIVKGKVVPRNFNDPDSKGISLRDLTRYIGADRLVAHAAESRTVATTTGHQTYMVTKPNELFASLFDMYDVDERNWIENISLQRGISRKDAVKTINLMKSLGIMQGDAGYHPIEEVEGPGKINKSWIMDVAKPEYGGRTPYEVGMGWSDNERKSLIHNPTEYESDVVDTLRGSIIRPLGMLSGFYDKDKVKNYSDEDAANFLKSYDMSTARNIISDRDFSWTKPVHDFINTTIIPSVTGVPKNRIRKYAEGTPNIYSNITGNGTAKGPGIAGEAGKELISDPGLNGGKPFMVDQPTLFNFTSATIIPNKLLDKLPGIPKYEDGAIEDDDFDFDDSDVDPLPPANLPRPRLFRKKIPVQVPTAMRMDNLPGLEVAINMMRENAVKYSEAYETYTREGYSPLMDSDGNVVQSDISKSLDSFRNAQSLMKPGPKNVGGNMKSSAAMGASYGGVGGLILGGPIGGIVGAISGAIIGGITGSGFVQRGIATIKGKYDDESWGRWESEDARRISSAIRMFEGMGIGNALDTTGLDKSELATMQHSIDAFSRISERWGKMAEISSVDPIHGSARIANEIYAAPLISHEDESGNFSTLGDLTTFMNTLTGAFTREQQRDDATNSTYALSSTDTQMLLNNLQSYAESIDYMGGDASGIVDAINSIRELAGTGGIAFDSKSINVDKRIESVSAAFDVLTTRLSELHPEITNLASSAKISEKALEAYNSPEYKSAIKDMGFRDVDDYNKYQKKQQRWSNIAAKIKGSGQRGIEETSEVQYSGFFKKGNIESQYAMAGIQRNMEEFAKRFLEPEMGNKWRSAFKIGTGTVQGGEHEISGLSTQMNVSMIVPKKLAERLGGGSEEGFNKLLQDLVFKPGMKETEGGIEKVSYSAHTGQRSTAPTTETSAALRTSATLQGYGRRMTALSMGAMGTYFSVTGIYGAISQGIAMVTDSIKDLSNSLKSIAIADSFSNGLIKSSEIMKSMGVEQNDFIEGWKRMQSLQAGFQVFLGSIAASVFKGDMFDNMADGLNKALSGDAGGKLAESIQAIVMGFIDLLPMVMEFAEVLAGVTKFVVDNKGIFRLIAGLTLFAFIAQPILTLFAVMLESIASLILLMGYLGPTMSMGGRAFMQLGTGAFTASNGIMATNGALATTGAMISPIIGLVIGLGGAYLLLSTILGKVNNQLFIMGAILGGVGGLLVGGPMGMVIGATLGASAFSVAGSALGMADGGEVEYLADGGEPGDPNNPTATLKVGGVNIGKGFSKLLSGFNRLNRGASTLSLIEGDVIGGVVANKVTSMAGGIPEIQHEYMADGGPKGTDIVNTWLTPGEFVVNKTSAALWAPILKLINGDKTKGPSKYMDAGGPVMLPSGVPDSVRSAAEFSSGNKMAALTDVTSKGADGSVKAGKVLDAASGGSYLNVKLYGQDSQWKGKGDETTPSGFEPLSWFSDFFQDVGKGTKNVDAGNVIGGGAAGALAAPSLDNIWDILKGLGKWIWDGITDVLGKEWNAIKGIGEWIWNGLKDVLGKIWDNLKLPDLSNFWEGLNAKLRGIWDNLKIPDLSTFWEGLKTKMMELITGKKIEQPNIEWIGRDEAIRDQWTNIDTSNEEGKGKGKSSWSYGDEYGIPEEKPVEPTRSPGDIYEIGEDGESRKAGKGVKSGEFSTEKPPTVLESAKGGAKGGALWGAIFSGIDEMFVKNKSLGEALPTMGLTAGVGGLLGAGMAVAPIIGGGVSMLGHDWMTEFSANVAGKLTGGEYNEETGKVEGGNKTAMDVAGMAGATFNDVSGWALTGATIGSVVPGAGTLVGGAVGAGVGLTVGGIQDLFRIADESRSMREAGDTGHLEGQYGLIGSGIATAYNLGTDVREGRGIPGAIGEAGAAAGEALTTAMNETASGITAAGSTISGAISGFATTITTGVTSIGPALMGIGPTILEGVKGGLAGLSDIGSSIREIILGMIKGIPVVGEAASTVVGAITDPVGTIGKIVGAADGGLMTKDGLINAHAGELIGPLSSLSSILSTNNNSTSTNESKAVGNTYTISVPITIHGNADKNTANDIRRELEVLLPRLLKSYDMGSLGI